MIETEGAVVSTLKVTGALLPLLPDESPWLATAVYAPSLGRLASTDHAPAGVTFAVSD